MTEGVLTSLQGAVFIQPSGPNTELFYLGQCIDTDDVVEPNGGKELIRCRKDNMKGWDVVGTKESPPDKVTFSITELKKSVRSWLVRLNCEVGVYILQRTCNEPTTTNWVNAVVLRNARVTNKTRSGLVSHETAAESTNKVDFEADPPVNEQGNVVAGRLTTAEVEPLNAIFVEPYSCGECGIASEDGQFAFAGSDAVGAGTANVDATINGGATWAALAVDPLAAAEDIIAISRFTVNANVTRLIVAKRAVGAAQGKISYSDNNGASWTVVNIGAAAAGHGAHTAHGLFVYSERLLLLAGDLGFIYKSIDGGVSWVVVEAGAIMITDWEAVHMFDENYGIASGDGDVIAVTRDGGDTWNQVTATGTGDDMLACQLLDRTHAWVSTDGGEIWYTNDFGVTWTERPFATSGVGMIHSFHFRDEYCGMLAKDSAGPVDVVWQTIDGGYTWKPLTTPLNAGISHLRMVNPNLAFAVGAVVGGGTAVILKITD